MAVILNGSNQRINIGASVPQLDIRTSPITVYTEFKTSLASQRWIFFHGAGTAVSGVDYGLRIDSAGHLVAVWGYSTSNTAATVTSASAYNDGNWHRACMRLVRSGSDSVLRLYVDGSLVVTALTISGTHNTTTGGDRTVIGALANSNGTFSQFFNGELADVAVWDKAFTATQAQIITNGTQSPANHMDASMRAWWPLDYNARDLGPQGVNGTPINNPIFTEYPVEFDAVLPAIGASFAGGVELESEFEVMLPALRASFEVSQALPVSFVARLPAIRANFTAEVRRPPTYRFFPPVIERPPMALEPEILRRYRWPRGVSLVRDGGTFIETQHVTPRAGWIEGRDYFVGGYHYRHVSESVAEELIAAGYAPVLNEDNT
jgi:hypothetical protein